MARDFDFYSPFFSAAIVTSDGVRVPLWTNVAGGQDTATAKEFSKEENSAVANGLVSFPFLESLTIEMGLGYFPRMSAVLTPPFHDARAFLDSTLVENGKATLEAVIGYSAGTSEGPVLSSPFQALILEPDISIGIDSTITLNAFGVAGYDASVMQTSRSFSSRKRRDILDVIASGVDTAASDETGISVAADPMTGVADISPETLASWTKAAKPARRNLYLDFSAIEKGSEADLALDTEVTLAQGWKTDWMFMLQIANEAGCWLTMTIKKDGDEEKNIVQVISIGSHLADAPKYNLRLFDFVQGKLGPGYQTNNGTPNQKAAEGDFPILSVSTQSKQVWLPGSTKALVSSGINSRTGKVENRVWSDKNAHPATVTGGGGTAAVPDSNNSAGDTKEGKSGGPADMRDPNVATGDQVNKSRFVTDFSMGIALRVVTLGIPDILPGTVVAVRGVSQRFDFNYGVFTVRHMLGPSGFTTELELVSNTSALLSSVRKAQGSVNEEKVQANKVVAVPKEQTETFSGPSTSSASRQRVSQ